MRVISTAPHPLRGREHLGIGDTQGGVRRVDGRTEHGIALPSQGLFPLDFKASDKLCHPQIPGVGAKDSIYILEAPADVHNLRDRPATPRREDRPAGVVHPGDEVVAVDVGPLIAGDQAERHRRWAGRIAVQ
jgi:hypothetical protein